MHDWCNSSFYGPACACVGIPCTDLLSPMLPLFVAITNGRTKGNAARIGVIPPTTYLTNNQNY